MINLILFGPPGSGKGTQATNLVNRYNLIHISTGDLFRYEMGNNTPLGIQAKQYISRGGLVPDAITVGMLRNKVEAHPESEGFIFDGFPRTLYQCEALDELLLEKGTSISKLVMLDVPDEEIITRIKKRGETSGRADDLDEGIIRNRIRVYKNETAPVFDYYSQRGKAVKVNGVGDIDAIFQRLTAEIDALVSSSC